MTDAKKQTNLNCKLLFSAMNNCIKENSNRLYGSLGSTFSKRILMQFDLTKCSEYNDFATKNDIKLKYNLYDTQYLYNTHYYIYWDGVTKEMEIVLDN